MLAMIPPIASLAVAAVLGGGAPAPVAQDPDGTWTVAGSGYRAAFGTESATFFARGPVKGAEARVGLRLLSVGRRSGGGGLPAVRERRVEGALVRYERGELVELYAARQEGLEQSFELATLPPGEGDLVVRVALDGPLDLVSAREDELRFAAPGGAAIRVSELVAIDARGARVRGTLAWSGGRLELAVPGWFVEEAALPLLVDPLIGNAGTIATFSRTAPVVPNSNGYADVVYSPELDRYCAAWAGQQSAGGSGGVVSARFLLPDGSLAGPAKSLLDPTSGPSFASNPRIATAAGTRRFVIATRGGLSSGSNVWLASVDELGAFAPPTGLLDHEVTSLALAGDVSGADDDVLLAFTSSDAVFLREIDAVTLAVEQTLQLTPSGSLDGEVAISRDGGSAGCYFVSWSRGPRFGDLDVWGALVDRDLEVLVPPFAIRGTSEVEARADVDGDGRQWLVAFERVALVGDMDVFGRLVSWDAEEGVLHVSQDHVLADEPARNVRKPSVAWMGESYLVGFLKEFSPLDYDVYVKSVEAFGCADCEGEFLVDDPPTYEHSVVLGQRRGSATAGNEALIAWLTTTDTASPLGEPLKVATMEQRRFRADDGTVRDLGGGCGGGGTASASCGHAGTSGFSVRVEGAAALTPARLVLGVERLHAGCGGCRLLPLPFAVFDAVTDAFGRATLTMPLPQQPSLVGTELLVQWIVSTPGPCRSAGATPLGLSLSNALGITIE